MLRNVNRKAAAVVGAVVLAFGLLVGGASAAEISGNYIETRTCDVYTGPCFANAEMGITGQQAILAWNIEEGSHEGVDLSGLNVVLVVRAVETLGFAEAVTRTEPIRSVVLVDERANESQRAALAGFARQRAGKLGGETVRVASLPIEIKLDHIDMVGQIQAGDEVHLTTRKLAKGDCVCTNEEIYYPPLTEVENSAPAFTVDGGFAGRGLGQRWTNPNTRSAFLATFAY
ncbi:MAG: DUF1326 domain-containing protein [Pirellulales bacterium]